MTEPNSNPDEELPKGIRGGRAIRAVLNAAGGAIPIAGGILSAASGAWSESEQEKVNSFFKHSPAPTIVESAFEDTKGYELTELGQQFVHYAMTDLPLRIELKPNA